MFKLLKQFQDVENKHGSEMVQKTLGITSKFHF